MADTTPSGESRVALFLSIDILTTCFTLCVVSSRVGYRWAKQTLSISDYMISLAMLTALIHLILDIIITAKFGYARHQRDLSVELRGDFKTSILFWLIQIFTKFPLMFSKLSLCLVYRDILRTADLPIVRVCRVANTITMIVVVGFFTAATFVGIFACQPVYKSWLPKTPGHCIDTQIMFNYVTSSINILTSIAVICIPLPVLLNTKNKRIEIKQLIALVMLGMVDTIVSIIRLWMIGDLKHVKDDFTWLVIPTHLVIVLEFNITIVAASLVVMRPCFQAIFNTLFKNSQYNSNNTTAGGDHYYGPGSRAGYILSSRSADVRATAQKHASRTSDDNSSEGFEHAGAGIKKTVDIELSSRSISTEDILRTNERF